MPNTIAENLSRLVASRTDIASTITTKDGTVNAGDGFEEFPNDILTIPSGGGGGGSTSNAVNFYDYDGTIVQSYSADDFANLSKLPANPTHEGLTTQGWNWSLADAKSYVAAYGKLNIGQMYITSDGKTRLYISLPEGRTSPILQLYLTANSELDIDWGDGGTHSTFTTTSAAYKSERHEYSTPGDYVIAITAVSGGFVLQSSSTSISSILWDGNNSASSPDRAYINAIKKLEIGDGVTSIIDMAFQCCYSLLSITIPDSITNISNSAFSGCYSLSSITIPNSVKSIDRYMFSGCYSLSSITIPNSVTDISVYAFSSCYSLSSITIPNSVTKINTGAFQSCRALASVTLPESVTTIGRECFSGCYSLSSITIPNSVKSIDSSAFLNCYSLSLIAMSNNVSHLYSAIFQYCYSLSSITIPSSVTSIGGNAFSSCYSLSSITIPNSVTVIDSYAFQDCSYMSYIKFESTTPPTVSNSNAWSNVSTSTKILVPTGTLEVYKAATNYPNPSTYTYEEY